MIKKLCLALLLTLSAASSLSASESLRIVSVGGAVTETLFAIGGGTHIVGADTTSYYPMAANKLPKVGYQRTLAAEGVLSLSPTHIIGTEEAGPPATIEQLRNTGVSIQLVKAPKNISDIVANTLEIGKFANRDKAAQELANNILQKHKALAARVSKNPITKKVVFVMTHGAKTPMTAGGDTSANAILTLVGAGNPAAKFIGYKPLTAEAMVQMQPDVILTTERSIAQLGGMAQFLSLPGISLTPAGKNAQIIAMDGLRLLGFGPRTIDAATDLYNQLSIK
ncbi:ABC transporter substrate-binding protein [Sneathiella sp. P13V-1]|uniref:heme/hemin ABC transporter substrate-binding protein n=1 Tax=Sneathiella sp. P13V-1 TaxID=2697366 RepID=UPI00187B4AAD|nr:ABC transporter substrate-binding protein [Sneathiella sp. P13V-1]MBE7636602.1 ABC transporter substrate-binding protein [Sneathiella sp. P13V-1]